MDCEELLRSLNDYIDGDIDPSICERFEGYMQSCDPCRVVVDNIRNTVKLYRGDQELVEVPLETRTRLRRNLRQVWDEVHPRRSDTARRAGE